MSDYTDLVKRLRRDGVAARDTLKCVEMAPTVDPEDALEAADAIEAQAKRIEELEADLIEKINVDRIVLEELKESYRETIRVDDDEALLIALNAVISYYSTHEEYQEWIVEKNKLREKR